MSAVLTFYAGFFTGIGILICAKALGERDREMGDAYERWLRDLEREAESLEAETYARQGTRVPPEYFIDYQSLS